MSSPFSSTRPESGKSTPLIMLTSVVFPAPLGPISPVTWSRRRSKLTPFSAFTPSKERKTSTARKLPFPGGGVAAGESDNLVSDS
jgi:hypothetical protein